MDLDELVNLCLSDIGVFNQHLDKLGDNSFTELMLCLGTEHHKGDIVDIIIQLAGEKNINIHCCEHEPIRNAIKNNMIGIVGNMLDHDANIDDYWRDPILTSAKSADMIRLLVNKGI